MANGEHLAVLELAVLQGSVFSADHWLAWRTHHPQVEPDLSEADFRGKDLSNLNLSGVNLHRAYLSEANLTAAVLKEATLSRANLYEANKKT